MPARRARKAEGRRPSGILNAPRGRTFRFPDRSDVPIRGIRGRGVGRCRQGPFRFVRILVLVFGLATGAAAQAGISASPNPSDNGAYTVSWTAIALATKYQLLEDNRIVYEGGARSKAFSGKTAGSYAYTLTYCRPIGFPVANTVCNLPSNFDAVTVTVNSGTVKPKPPPAPAAPALTAPTSSTTGTYRVTWTKPSGAKTFELQQKVGSASWKGAYAGTAQRKDFSNQGTGAYSYRVRACAGQNNCGDWSATKNTRVTRTTSTISASPNPAPGGDYTVRWTTSALSSGYRLVENVNNGASTNTYNVNGLNKRFEDKAPGTYAYSLRTCFTLFNTVTCVPASGSVTVTVPVATGTISASPKTCTIPAGSNRCTTTVTWSTSNANSPCVFLEASERRSPTTTCSTRQIPQADGTPILSTETVPRQPSRGWFRTRPITFSC